MQSGHLTCAPALKMEGGGGWSDLGKSEYSDIYFSPFPGVSILSSRVNMAKLQSDPEFL